MNEWIIEKNKNKKKKLSKPRHASETSVLHYVLHYIMIYYLKILTGRKYVLIFSVVKTRLHTIVIAD